MRLRRRHFGLAAAIAVLAGVALASGYDAGGELCRFKDADIRESSGLAASAHSDQYFYTHNDSGSPNRVYVVARDGSTLATLNVTGAESVDWEDMARGPGGNGGSALYIGDIGDNLRRRERIVVYRVREPELDLQKPGTRIDTEPAECFEFQYPDGAHDAETLLVHPHTGQLVIVTKSPLGCGVYAAPPPFRTDRVNPLVKISWVRFADYGVAPKVSRPALNLDSIKNAAKDLAVSLLSTGGDISPDGKRLVVRTYTAAYEWDISDGNLAEAFRRPPMRIALPPTRQGEAICYTRDGNGLLISTEGEHAPVHEIRRRP